MTPNKLRVNQPDPQSVNQFHIRVYSADKSSLLSSALINCPGTYPAELDLTSSGLFNSIPSGTSVALTVSSIGFTGVETVEVDAANNPALVRKDPEPPLTVTILS